MPRPGRASPVLVESHEGRPTKVEGNPKHPDSAGATDAIAQASVLDLYDPDRFSPVLHGGAASTWQAYDTFAGDHFAALRRRKGQGLHVLSEDVASPSLDLLREHLGAVMPEARWHTYEAIGPANARAGATLAFGSPVVPRCSARSRRGRAGPRLRLPRPGGGGRPPPPRVRPGQASRGADRLDEPALRRREPVLAHGRHGRSPAPAPGEPGPRLHRWPWRGRCSPARARTSRCEQALQATAPRQRHRPRDAIAGPWIEEVAADLKAHAGRAVILAGRRQPPLVHALVHAMNAALGNLGKTVELRSGPSSTGGGDA